MFELIAQDREQRRVARRVARERELGGGTDGQLLGVVAIPRPRQDDDDPHDRPGISGGEIIAPQRIEDGSRRIVRFGEARGLTAWHELLDVEEAMHPIHQCELLVKFHLTEGS